MPHQHAGFIAQVCCNASRGAAVKCELAGEVLRSFGALRLQVNGWSMLPTILPGDTLMIQRADSRDISRGDIILFGRDDRFFVHRVLKASDPNNSAIVTQGDSMPAPDPPICDRDLLGKVSFIMRHKKFLNPRKARRLPERAVAALVKRSEFAARVVVRAHELRRTYWN